MMAGRSSDFKSLSSASRAECPLGVMGIFSIHIFFHNH